MLATIHGARIPGIACDGAFTNLYGEVAWLHVLFRSRLSLVSS